VKIQYLVLSLQLAVVVAEVKEEMLRLLMVYPVVQVEAELAEVMVITQEVLVLLVKDMVVVVLKLHLHTTGRVVVGVLEE
jgi:hypothetical protein